MPQSTPPNSSLPLVILPSLRSTSCHPPTPRCCRAIPAWSPRHGHLRRRRSPQRREEGGCCIDPAPSPPGAWSPQHGHLRRYRPPWRRVGGGRCTDPTLSSPDRHFVTIVHLEEEREAVVASSLRHPRLSPCHQSIRPPSLIQLARSTVPYPRFELKYLQKDSPTSVGDLLSSALVCVQICDYIPKKRGIACLGVCFF